MLLAGGVAGAPPPHKGGPNRPDRPEMQWSVVSGQLSEAALSLPRSLTRNGNGFVADRGGGEVAPFWDGIQIGAFLNFGA